MKYKITDPQNTFIFEEGIDFNEMKERLEKGPSHRVLRDDTGAALAVRAPRIGPQVEMTPEEVAKVDEQAHRKLSGKIEK